MNQKRLFLIPAMLLLVLNSVIADSGVLTLQEPDVDNIEDSYVQANDPTAPKGTQTNLFTRTLGVDEYIYLLFITRNLSQETTITNATLYIWSTTEEDHGLNIHEVNATWDEEILTWNNQPCGVGFDNAANCNLTSAGLTPDGVVDTWYPFEATAMVKKAVAEGRGNISMALKPVAEGGTTTQIFSSKENADVIHRPILNITWENATQPTPEFTITAVDAYDESTINFFNVTVFNTTYKNSTNTSIGSLVYSNLGGLMNINITSNQSGGYFSRYYSDYNVSSNLVASLTQSYLSLNVTDLLTGSGLSSFTVDTNYSTYQGTNGYILLPSNAGFHTFNITSSQYPLHEFSYTISALENLSFTANISPRFQFYLRREADDSPFDIAGTNSTKLNIFCPSKSIVITFRNLTYNSTQENITMDCSYTYMKMDVSYSDSSYFRTLIPPTTQQNITWWLLDLNRDTGVQKILQLVDITGEWTTGLIRIRRSIGASIENMIEQFFDVSTSVTLYLLKDAIYTIVLQNNDATEERQLGLLTADSAGTVTITYPNIPFYPSDTILEDNISWSYTCPFSQCPPPHNTSDFILRLHYVDSTSDTSSITWTIRNGSNTTRILQTFTSTASDVIFTYQPVVYNMTYVTTLFVDHNLLAFNITDTKIFGDIIEAAAPGFTAEEESNLKKYAAGIFIIIWGLLFSAYHSGLGLGSAFIFVLVFRAIGWIEINYVWISLMGFAAVMAFIYESQKKD